MSNGIFQHSSDRKSFAYKDYLDAFVRSGGARSKKISMCGDALLIDFKNSFFAVADSPERNPQASRTFLKKMSDMVNSLSLRTANTPSSNKEIQEDTKEIINSANALIKSIDYTDNTTFTGLFIFKNYNIRKALLLHCGDSLLYHLRMNTGDGVAQKITQTNHCFVGKFNQLYETKLFDFYSDSLFLLATDGLFDLVRETRHNDNTCIEDILYNAMKDTFIRNFCTLFVEKYDLKRESSDDIGFIAFDPNKKYSKHDIHVLL